jgi:MATE family multidrug resistance protein
VASHGTAPALRGGASTWVPEIRTLARLSWPATVTQIGIMLTGVVDTLMLARVSVDALAASALGSMWQWGVLSIGVGAVLGIDPLISQAHGRGDGPGTALALQRGLVVAALASIPVCAAMLLTGAGLRMLGQPPQIATLAQSYSLLKLPTVPCFLVFTALRQFLQGRGMLAAGTWAIYVASVLNAVLGYALIFGRLGLPALGLRGAAIADTLTSFAQVVGLWTLVRVLRLDHAAKRAWDREAFSRGGILQTLRYGVPVGLQMSLEAWAFTLAAFMAGWISVQAIGSHQIVLNMAALSYMLPLGVSMGTATRVGNLIGEGDAEGMRRAVRSALSLGAGMMIFAASAFTFLRHELPRLYTDDPALLALAAQILPIAGAFQLADGTQGVAAGVLRGMGRPQIAALINLLGYYAVALPLAYALGFRTQLGLVGVWIALAVGLLAVACAMLFWIRRTLHTPLAELQVQLNRAA